MPKISYKNIAFQSRTIKIINKAIEVIKEYEAQGFALTVRQLYYQFVSRGWMPNTNKNYTKLDVVINRARLAGYIDWDSIEDRTRFLRKNSHWNNPKEIIKDAIRQYTVNKWKGQEYMPEVWIEKDALVDVISRPCKDFDVPYFSCRGYISQSSMWKAAQRMRRCMNNGQIPVLFHLGDHDPSGIDMTRDIQERLWMFGVDELKVERIALTIEQIEEQKPPPSPAKITDSRWRAYAKIYGQQSWELDALEPSYLVNLVENNIKILINQKLWEEREQLEEDGKELLQMYYDDSVDA